MDYILFIHLSVDGHLDCFHFLVNVNKTALIIWVQVLGGTYVFIYLF